MPRSSTISTESWVWGALHWWIFSGMTQVHQCPSQSLALETRHRTPAVICRTGRAELSLTFVFWFKKAGLNSNQQDLIILCGAFYITDWYVPHIKVITLSLIHTQPSQHPSRSEDVGNFPFAAVAQNTKHLSCF